jgi:hypothetical protein
VTIASPCGLIICVRGDAGTEADSAAPIEKSSGRPHRADGVCEAAGRHPTGRRMTQAPVNPSPGYEPAPWPGQPHAAAGRRPGLPTWAKVLIGVGAAGALLVILMCSGVIYLGVVTPETRALAGTQLTKRDLDTMRELGLLDGGERVKYFYSDGLLSIEEGMYFFTDEKIVVYGEKLDPPATMVAYEDVVDITADFSDSWWVDGTIWIELADGTPLVMPISAEGGVDEFFYDSLVETWKAGRHAAAVP